MKIHYLQHVPFEGPGAIEFWMEIEGHQVSRTRLFEPKYEFPHTDDIDGLIVLGGPMGVYNEEIYPWLALEKRFIEACIESGKKILGICLGAQLISACLGAKIRPAPLREIGWFPVIPTLACNEFPWFYELFQHRPTVFHWHGDKFDIPSKCTNLLSSDANDNQAFIYNQTVVGLQFHVEVESKDVLLMIQMCRSELGQGKHVQRIPKLVHGTAYCRENHRLLFKLLDRIFNSDKL